MSSQAQTAYETVRLDSEVGWLRDVAHSRMELNSMNLLSQIRAVNHHASSIVPLVCPACRREGNFQPLGQDLALQLLAKPTGSKFVVVGYRQCTM
jgi:hypothetical protein